MKKGLSIILMLSLVVIVFSLAVYFIEDITTPIIEARQQKEIEDALKEVYPAIEGSGYTTEEADIDYNNGVTAATVIKDGDVVKAVIYTVVFRGFSSDITYVVGVNDAGEITGYKTISQNDTAGYGAQIADPVNWEQFPGMLLATAADGSFDGLTGASVTTGGWITSFNLLEEFHNDAGLIEPLTDAQVAQGKAASIAPEGSTLTPLVATGVKTLEELEISYAFLVNDGTNDIQVIYYDVFDGPYGENEIIVSFDLATNKVIEFKALSSGDTPEYGGQILDDSRWTQFAEMEPSTLVNGEFDGIAGSTLTTDAWKASMQNISIFHQSEFQGIIAYTPEELFVIYQHDLVNDDILTDVIEEVTAQKLENMNVTNVYDVRDDEGTYLGTVYFVNTLGVYEDGPTFIQFLIGINAAGEFTGIKLFNTTASGLEEDGFFDADYGDEIIGLDIEDVVTLDEIEDNPITSAIIQSALEEVARYHVEDYPIRAGSYDADEADLLLAYPTAVTFTSVYGAYEFNENIGNIYEAKDGTDTLLGYVYVGKYAGREDDVVFAIGFDVAGTIQQAIVIEDAETWGMAQDFGSYNGSYGTDFTTSSWLDEFDGVSDYLNNQVDSVAGVTTTVGGANDLFGFLDVVELIFNYHDDQSVGGAS